VEDWIFNEIAANYILNEEMRRWFEEHNVWAAEEIARRLVEAAERGLWNADEETLRALREAYGEIEGILEDALVGDVQGGEIRVMTHEDVERWADAMKEVKDIWKRAREG
jgi:cobaltochelatase CobN